MKPSFYHRGEFVQVRIPHNGTYLRMSTGIKVGKPNTDKLIQRHTAFILGIKGADVKEIYSAYVNPVKAVIKDDTYDLATICNLYIAQAKAGKITKKDGTRIKDTTIRSYEFAANAYGKYAGTTTKLDLLNFDMSKHTEIAKKREVKAKWDKHFNGFIQYMRDNDFRPNTVANVILVLSIMFKHYTGELFILTPELPSTKTYEKPIVVLPPDFIKKFLNDYDQFQGEERFAWEVYATILVTTMRISDVISLKWQDLSVTNNTLAIAKMNKKTGAITTMELPKSLANIFIENYKSHSDIFTPVQKDRLATIYRLSSILFSRYEELKQLVSVNEVGVNGEYETVTKELYNWVSPHMLRKTAITSMLVNGVSEQHVKFASGHTEKSHAFERYRGFVEKNFQNEISKYYESFN